MKMPRTVHLTLTRDAEEFVRTLEKEGLSERDIFAKALGLLQRAYMSKRVVMARENVSLDKSEDIEYIFSVVSDGRRKEETPGPPLASEEH
jgi:hypothetical protein